ncbi:uncharacterized protein CDAR_110161 [Caerostris darwini]|uniref:RNase H type-1 domain-containing protein n=1 Tax=Caerostris darwini TaxID=1538125 RepID=A0AAV4S936_9ARAC|nr:uncharacterized protein CDAR_110161 [Caerostris darwini]
MIVRLIASIPIRQDVWGWVRKSGYYVDKINATCRCVRCKSLQNFCLGPVLWNIFINEILGLDFGRNVKIQAFADDILIVIQEPATHCFTQSSKVPLQTLENWTNDPCLTINCEKCYFTVLSPKRYSRIPTIKINNNGIKFSKSIKYLGILIDSNLNWNAHLNLLQDKIFSIQQKFQRITRATWGLSPSIKKEIYSKVIGRIISYGLEVWFQGKAKQKLKILRLQRSGLLTVTKFYKTVATDTLQVLADTPPIDLKLALSQKLFKLKYDNLPLQLQGFAVRPQDLAFLKPINPPWEKCSTNWDYCNNSLVGTLIYTDGSKKENKVGGVFVVYQQGREIPHKCFRLNDHSSIFLAELTAIDQAIDYTISNSLPSAKIISDVRSVLLALQNLNSLDPNITNINKKLQNFEGTIQLYWIKAHVGLSGNEKADDYAKEATNNPCIDITTPISVNFIKSLLKKELMAEGQDNWTTSMKGRSVYDLFTKVNTNRVQGDFFLNQLMTGHGALAKYQERFFGKSANCQCGHQLEDTYHIVYDCPHWNHVRMKYLPRCFKETSLDLLLFNKISRAGLREIMALKLQKALQQEKDTDSA